MTEPDKVILAGNNSTGQKAYHTDVTCPSVKSANKTRLAPKDSLFDDMRECKKCSGKADKGHPPDDANSHHGPKGHQTQCRSCGDELPSPDADCEWCERYEEVMGEFA